MIHCKLYGDDNSDEGDDEEDVCVKDDWVFWDYILIDNHIAIFIIALSFKYTLS